MKANLPSLLLDTRSAMRQGSAGLERRQRARLAELAAYVRAHSPYFQEIYRGLPERIDDPTLLPVTRKTELMARFDDWATDRAVRLEPALAFSADPDTIGQPFLGRYKIMTTSGTTGTAGIFVTDAGTVKVTSALAVRLLGSWLRPRELLTILTGSAPSIAIVASGAPLATNIAAMHVRDMRWFGEGLHILSVYRPLPELVAALNREPPVVIALYATTAALLANEQEAGRLHVSPKLMILAAEGLAEADYGRVASAFNTRLGNMYVCTECTFMAQSCNQGWLHVNNDWVILEPVDADYRPVPPGEQSQTVLLTNLANRVQPVLRYDLGDSILQRGGPCPCGDPRPAIRVQGRAADVLVFPNGRGKPVSIVPLAFGNLTSHVVGAEILQVVQSAPAALRVRLQPRSGFAREDVWRDVESAVARLLADHGLATVTVELAEVPPVQAKGGKYRTVIPLA